MQFHMDTAEIYIPDGIGVEQALEKTTHLAIAAHQDDIEIMATAPILSCFQQPDRWFTGVVVTDGRGSPRDGIYGRFSDEEMRQIRFKEQRKAAYIGEYAAQVMLDYPSKVVKDAAKTGPAADILALMKTTCPKVVYTHNLADKHDSHVAVALRVIQAIRELPKPERPTKLYGCEVWRDLDWMLDSDKTPFDVSTRQSLQAALVGVFDSQIAGGKRYDLGTMGRRKANATYSEPHGVDESLGITNGIDLTPLITDPDKDITAFTLGFIQRFANDVTDRIVRFQ